MPPQPRPDLEQVVLRTTTPGGGARRRHPVDDAWEAVVREELLRVRRGHARSRRFGRPPDRGVGPARPRAGEDQV